MKIENFKVVEVHTPEKNRFVRADTHKKKRIEFNFKLTSDDKKKWESGNGVPKLAKLLKILSEKYGDINSFRLGFFRGDRDSFVENKDKKIVLMNWDKFFDYGRFINTHTRDYAIGKMFYEMSSEFSSKTVEHFFNKSSKQVLLKDVQNSYYTIIDNLIKKFEQLPKKERKEIENILEISKFGRTFKEKLINLKPEAPEIQLELFLKVIDKLGHREAELLLKTILSSKISTTFIDKISKLPYDEQVKMAKKMGSMIALSQNYEKIKKSLKRFEKIIQKHKRSNTKNEKDIHKFLAKEWWLLGIEYFNKAEVRTDIDAKGKQTKETRIGRFKPDFIIEKYDGIKDSVKVIEIEEANDKIFTKNGTLSPDVFDGINQAVNYVIEQKLRGIDSKGIAIIGSVHGMSLTKSHKRRLRLLSESFHNIEILTYDEIIEKAKATIEFFSNYRKKYKS